MTTNSIIQKAYSIIVTNDCYIRLRVECGLCSIKLYDINNCMLSQQHRTISKMPINQFNSEGDYDRFGIFDFSNPILTFSLFLSSYDKPVIKKVKTFDLFDPNNDVVVFENWVDKMIRTLVGLNND